MSLDPTGIVDAIKYAFSAVASIFGYAGKRSDANNAADVKASKSGQNESDASDKLTTAIKKKDTKYVQDAISE